MKSQDPPHPEDFAQLLQRLKADYGGLGDSEVARRIGVSVSTVNTWVHRKRKPRPDAIRALAKAFPKFSEEEIFAAVGRQTPGPVSPEAEQRLLELFSELTEEQQELQELQIRAVVERNRSSAS